MAGTPCVVMRVGLLADSRKSIVHGVKIEDRQCRGQTFQASANAEDYPVSLEPCEIEGGNGPFVATLPSLISRDHPIIPLREFVRQLHNPKAKVNRFQRYD